MRVLVLHSAYLSGAVSGENRVVEDEAKLLKESGQNIRLAVSSPDADSAARLAMQGIRTIWSKRSVDTVKAEIESFEPDVIHAHNVFPTLSPAVLRLGTEIPIVVTLHNYRLLCLPATLMRDQADCEDCLGRMPWRGVLHRCYRDSYLASAALAGSLIAHRAVDTFDRVALWLPVSQFVLEKHVQAGFDRTTMWTKPNFSWPAPQRKGPGDYFLFVGRISGEKGLPELLRIWNPDWGRLVVVGSGPDAARLSSDAPPEVTWMGALQPEELGEVIARARALVVPSISPEASGRVIIEAYAAGVPAIVHRRGGMTELVLDGETGYVVDLHDDEGWDAAVTRLQDDVVSLQMGSAAHDMWQARYSPRVATENLLAAYTLARRGSLGPGASMDPQGAAVPTGS